MKYDQGYDSQRKSEVRAPPLPSRAATAAARALLSDGSDRATAGCSSLTRPERKSRVTSRTKLERKWSLLGRYGFHLIQSKGKMTLRALVPLLEIFGYSYQYPSRFP